MTHGKELENQDSQLASILMHCKKMQPTGTMKIMSDDIIDFGMTESRFHKALLRAQEDKVLIISERYWIEDATNEEFESGSAVIATVDYYPTKDAKKDVGKKWLDYDDGFQVSTDKERVRYKKKPLGLTESESRILERILQEPKDITVPFVYLADAAKIKNVAKNISTYVSNINSSINNASDGKIEKYLKNKSGDGYYR